MEIKSASRKKMPVLNSYYLLFERIFGIIERKGKERQTWLQSP